MIVAVDVSEAKARSDLAQQRVMRAGEHGAKPFRSPSRVPTFGAGRSAP